MNIQDTLYRYEQSFDRWTFRRIWDFTHEKTETSFAVHEALSRQEYAEDFCFYRLPAERKSHLHGPYLLEELSEDDFHRISAGEVPSFFEPWAEDYGGLLTEDRERHESIIRDTLRIAVDWWALDPRSSVQPTEAGFTLGTFMELIFETISGFGLLAVGGD